MLVTVVVVWKNSYYFKLNFKKQITFFIFQLIIISFHLLENMKLTPKKSLGFRLADFRADGSTELSILGSSHFSSFALLAT